MIKDCRRRIANQGTQDSQSQLQHGFVRQHPQQGFVPQRGFAQRLPHHGFEQVVSQHGVGQQHPHQEYIPHVQGLGFVQPSQGFGGQQVVNTSMSQQGSSDQRSSQDPRRNGQWQGALADQAGNGQAGGRAWSTYRSQ